MLRFRLSDFDSVAHAAPYAARHSGATPALAAETLNIIERHFNDQTWRVQAQLARALCNVAKSHPHHRTRILRFIGRHIRTEDFAVPRRPRQDQTAHATGARGYLHKALLNLVRKDRKRAVIRFIVRKYANADREGRRHLLHVARRVAGTENKEYSDAVLRLALRHGLQDDTEIKNEWIGLGLSLLPWTQPKLTLDFIESAFRHASSDQRREMMEELAEHTGASHAERAVDMAERFRRKEPDRLRFPAALVFAAAYGHATRFEQHNLAQKARALMERIHFRKNEFDVLIG